jgi:hypothetical protein
VTDDALIGCTGFVGTSLLRYARFGSQFSSTNIQEARGKSFRRVVCAAAPATMWLANQDPAADRANLLGLAKVLATLDVDQFVLVSSIAVLDDPGAGYTEATVNYETAKAYGRHRRELEEFAASHFPAVHILRLPALFGPGLKKNFLFDLLNPAPSFIRTERFSKLPKELSAGELALVRLFYTFDENLGMWVLDRLRLAVSPDRAEVERAFARIGFVSANFTNSASRFQYFGLHRLAATIERTVELCLPLLHVCSAPLEAGFLSRRLIGKDFSNPEPPPVREDMRTLHADQFGGTGDYMFGEAQVLRELQEFAAGERAA